MEQTRHSKLITDIPEPAMVICMGCDVDRPCIGHRFDQNRNLPDPTGMDDAIFLDVIGRYQDVCDGIIS